MERYTVRWRDGQWVVWDTQGRATLAEQAQGGVALEAHPTKELAQRLCDLYNESIPYWKALDARLAARRAE